MNHENRHYTNEDYFGECLHAQFKLLIAGMRCAELEQRNELKLNFRI